jgi:hypothetical protein
MVAAGKDLVPPMSIEPAHAQRAGNRRAEHRIHWGIEELADCNWIASQRASLLRARQEDDSQISLYRRRR